MYSTFQKSFRLVFSLVNDGSCYPRIINHQKPIFDKLAKGVTQQLLTQFDYP